MSTFVYNKIMQGIPHQFSQDAKTLNQEQLQCFQEGGRRIGRKYPILEDKLFVPAEKAFFLPQDQYLEKSNSDRGDVSLGFTTRDPKVILINVDRNKHPLSFTQTSAHERIHYLTDNNNIFPMGYIPQNDEEKGKKKFIEYAASEIIVDFLAANAMGFLNVESKHLPEDVITEWVNGKYINEVLRNIPNGASLAFKVMENPDAHEELMKKCDEIFGDGFYSQFVIFASDLYPSARPPEMAAKQIKKVLDSVAKVRTLKEVVTEDFRNAQKRMEKMFYESDVEQ